MRPPRPKLPLVSLPCAPSELDARELEEMQRLMARHFHGVDRRAFEADLAAKDWVLRLFEDNKLVGFSTLAVDAAVAVGDRGVNVIYSGDTIMEPQAWSSLALPKSWIQLVERITTSLPALPCYWLLISSGFRTYRFLPVFWQEFWPRFDRPTPPEQQTLLETLAERRFGTQFNPCKGVVQLQHPHRLRSHLKRGADRRSEGDPHIAFFAQSNPQWELGDELVCLAELSRENLTPAGKRIWTSPPHES